MKEQLKKRIRLSLQKSGRRPVPYKELLKKLHIRQRELGDFRQALKELSDAGYIFERRQGFVLTSAIGAFPATVSRINKTFGFIKRSDNETEVFIPGKYLKGAMPGDTVLACLIPSRTGNPEGEVLSVLEESTARFTGVVLSDYGKLFILPDSLSKTPIALRHSADEPDFKVGDKVMAELVSRGDRHSEHKAAIVSCFGSALKASSCARSVLELNGVELEFPEEVKAEALKISQRKVTEDEIEKRTDLREMNIFTIDGADTKDIDDAISLEKTEIGYTLGVHIADVSYYVRPKTAIDDDAFNRGTSIYYADRVVPMLPKELSNGICSLNPMEDRLAFSCIMNLDEDGKVVDFKFRKTAIRSRVKGVYKEVNEILDGTATEKILKKYEGQKDTIFLMKKLADILTAAKLKRGAPQIETAESKLIINDEDVCVDVKPRTRGAGEVMIEEFMLLANGCAAKLGKEKKLPFVYRVHENPSLEKIAQLKETLLKLNLEIPDFSSVKPSHLAKILEEAKDTPLFPAVNKMVLRSMAKAKYAPEPLGHFGLVLADYAHFTSPIRRYPDLSIHRILSDYVGTLPIEKIQKKYEAFAEDSSRHSTETELTAMTVERDCEDCYKAEYMSSHVGEEFEGVISSVTEFGFYVELENTVEGLVKADSLTDGIYDFDGGISFKNLTKQKVYTIGDKVRVLCAKAEVSSGNVDFEFIPEG